MWEALQEPEPSDDDELDTEDGELNTPGSSSGTIQRARDGRTESTKNTPLSAPPAFASTSTNAVVGDNSRSQMKRKELESFFTSKKRTRYASAPSSDQDDAMDLDSDEHTKYKRLSGINSKPAPEQRTMGKLVGWQPGASRSVSSTTMNRKSGNDSASPIIAKPKLMRKSSGMKPPPLPKRSLSNSAKMAESTRPATRDPPSKLANLPFDAYKGGERKTAPTSFPGRSVASASPVDKKFVDKAKAPLKHQQVPSASQSTRQLSKSKSRVPSDSEIIVISDDDDSPPPSISQAKSKSKSKSIKPFSAPFSAPTQVRQNSRTSRNASGSALKSTTKGSFPEPREVIEIFDSDDEQLPSKAELPKKNVGTSSGRVQEGTTGSKPSRHNSTLVGEGSDGNADVDGGDFFNIPLSPGALSEELHVTEDTNDNRGTQPFIPDFSSSPSSVGLSPRDNYLSTPPAPQDTNDNRGTQPFIPLFSSSPSSVGLSPRDNYLSTPPAPQSPITSITKISSPRPQSFPLPTRPNSFTTKKPTTSSPSVGSSTGSPSNRLGFSSIKISSSLRAPPPPDKHRRQFARKMATQTMPDEKEDTGESSSSSESEGTTNIKVNKGKEKEVREPSSSSSGTESISMRGLRDALAMGSDKFKQRLVSPTQPKKQGQTLAEAITSAGLLNRTKKMRRRLERNTKDVPADPTFDDETGVKDGPTADGNEKALKAAIGSSRLLVNLLPALKEKNNFSAAAAAAASKVTESPASTPQGEKLPSSPMRAQDFHAQLVPPESPSTKIERSSYPLSPLSPNRNIIADDVPSEKPLVSLEMEVDSESSFGKVFGASTQLDSESSFHPDRNITAHDVPSEKPLLSLEMEVDSESSFGASAQLDSESSIGKISGATPQLQTEPSTAFEFKSGTTVIVPHKTADPETIQTSTSPLSIDPPASSSIVPTSSNDAAAQDESFYTLGLPSDNSPNDDEVECQAILPSPNTDVVEFKSGTAVIVPHETADLESIQTSTSPLSIDPPASSSILPHKTADLETIQTSTSPLSIDPSASSSIVPHKTADLETIQTSTSPLSIDPPASSSIVPTSSNDAAAQDEAFYTLGLPSDNSPNDDEEECQALLQSPNMDVVPSHDIQSPLQDRIVVKPKSSIGLDTSFAASSSLESLSATTKVFNESGSVSLPTPEVPTRRSSRLSSNRSSRSASSEGFGIVFDSDSGPSNSAQVSRPSTPEVEEFSALPSPAKTYGGFRALTWKDFRKDLKNFTPKTYYAKDLPHTLQDHINSMSEYTQMMQGMRDLFKATILENTVEDEPDAPPIEIWNSVDTQSTPPWEFYYTNHMWLGEGVPPPDFENLLSCTCKGGCNPKSKTCACLMRQREAACDPQLEFAYDKNGRLKIPGYPIFECNDLCGCSDECRNRVVQHGRKVPVSIGKTESKGWGVFAGPRKIPEGTFIGIYSGELLTDADAQERGIKYNKFGRTYLFDIDFHHLNDGNPSWENSFTVDAYHAGNFTRFLNHSCDPNCRLYACYINEGNIQKPLLTVFTRRDIEPFEEICFNYQGKYDDGDDEDDEDEEEKDDDNGNHVKDVIYVRCRCGAKNCTGTMFK